MGQFLLHLDNILGTGSFSKVYYGEMIKRKDSATSNNKIANDIFTFEDLPKDNKYAIKEIANATLQRILGAKGQESLKKEINISRVLNHKNIVKLYEYVRTENNNYLIFEYCGGGDLKQFLKERKRLTEPVAQKFMR